MENGGRRTTWQPWPRLDVSSGTHKATILDNLNQFYPKFCSFKWWDKHTTLRIQSMKGVSRRAGRKHQH